MLDGVELVVAEAGSRWPAWLNGTLGGDADRLIVAEDSTLGRDELVPRTVRHIERTAGQGRRVRRAVVLLGPWHENASERREELARTLLTHLAPEAPAELVFGARDATDRHDLLAMVGILGSLLAGTALTISVRFGEGAGSRSAGDRPSHVRLRRPPAFDEQAADEV